jgi:hypothetical protein
VNRYVSICHRSVELPDEVHSVVWGAVGNVGHALGESFALFIGDRILVSANDALVFLVAVEDAIFGIVVVGGVVVTFL